MFENQISEVEKEEKELVALFNFSQRTAIAFKLARCQAKLSTLKSAQAKFKEQEELNNDLIDSANLELTRFKKEFKNIDDKRLYWKKKAVSLIKELEEVQTKFNRFVEDLIKKSESYDLNSAEAIQFRNAINKKIDELSSKEKKDE
jgi:hypothetical protein